MSRCTLHLLGGVQHRVDISHTTSQQRITMTNQPTRAVGIPWYAAEDYPRIKAMMEDGHLLPQVHADWLRKAEQLESQARRQGQLVVRAHLRPDEFSGWCAARGLHVNAQARTQFAASIAAEEHGRTH